MIIKDITVIFSDEDEDKDLGDKDQTIKAVRMPDFSWKISGGTLYPMQLQYLVNLSREAKRCEKGTLYDEQR